MNNRRCFLAFFLFCVTALLPAQSNNEQEREWTVVRVTGTVRLTGNANFPQIVITGSDMQWNVVREEMNKLYDLQHQTVTVEGEETVREIRYANGLLSGRILRELRNIRIISIEEYTGP